MSDFVIEDPKVSIVSCVMLLLYPRQCQTVLDVHIFLSMFVINGCLLSCLIEQKRYRSRKHSFGKFAVFPSFPD